jgi:hypothetical protein
MGYASWVMSDQLKMTNLSNGSCRVIRLFKWVVSRLKCLTCLAKQIVSLLALNRLASQVGRPKPEMPTRIASPN